jgi:hypothetical protein
MGRTNVSSLQANKPKINYVTEFLPCSTGRNPIVTYPSLYDDFATAAAFLFCCLTTDPDSGPGGRRPSSVAFILQCHSFTRSCSRTTGIVPDLPRDCLHPPRLPSYISKVPYGRIKPSLSLSLAHRSAGPREPFATRLISMGDTSNSHTNYGLGVVAGVVEIGSHLIGGKIIDCLRRNFTRDGRLQHGDIYVNQSRELLQRHLSLMRRDDQNTIRQKYDESVQSTQAP